MDGKDGSETIGLGRLTGKKLAGVWSFPKCLRCRRGTRQHMLYLCPSVSSLWLWKFPSLQLLSFGVCSRPFKQLRTQRYSVWQDTEAGFYTNCFRNNSFTGPFWGNDAKTSIRFSPYASCWYFINKKVIIEFYSICPEGWWIKTKLHNDSVRPVLSTSLELWSSCLRPLYRFYYILLT